ncbi:nitroreductase family protein [Chloroflexota bacterium]
MDVYEAIKTRRTTRRFKNEPVPPEVLTRSVDAARLAPTAKNQQALEYLIIDDPELYNKIYAAVVMVDSYSSGRLKTGAELRPKAYIAILINHERESPHGNSGEYNPYDIAMAAENIILTAVAAGLATCPILLFKPERLKEILSLPESHDAGMLVALGYGAETSVTYPLTDSVAFEVDEKGVRHLPKRELKDVIHHNSLGTLPVGF